MAKKRKSILFAVSLITALFIGWWFVGSREPSYNGKSLSEWADIGLKATDTAPWDIPNVLLASNAIRQIGAKAVPLAYSWSGKMPSWGPIDDQLRELSDRVGWVERLPKGEDRSGYAAFRLRPSERGGFMTYALQEEMASGFENLSRTNQFGPGWVFNSLNDRTLLMFFEQLPPNPSPEVVTAVLLEMRATGRNEATFGPTLWAFSRATTNAGLHFLALRCLARTGFRTEESAGMLAKFPVSTNRSGFVSPLGIMATFRQLGPAGWPYLVYSLTNQISAVRRTAFEELALDWIDTESSSNWSPRFRLVLSSLFRSGVSFPSTNRLEFMAAQPDELRRAFVEQATEFFPSKPNAMNVWDRTNAVVILSRFTNDPSPPIAARSLEVLQKINAMPPAQ